MAEVVIFDIEGTICPITFVKDELFPYFLQQIGHYLSQLTYPLDANSSDEITLILAGFPSEVTTSYEVLYNHIQHLVKTDQKVAPLKSFQGIVWKIGYDNGDLQAPLYEDAIEFFTSNPPTIKKVYIYSSGSVKAQKLLFAHVRTSSGCIDLNSKLSGYFDITTSGFKQEVTSYKNILKDVGYSDKPEKVLFLSDNVNEVKAAREAGLKSVVVIKPGNALLSEEDKQKYTTITSLKELTWH